MYLYTIEEVKQAVDKGLSVRWDNNSYTVVKDNLGRYLIVHTNGTCESLDNYLQHPNDFYVLN